MSGGARRTLFFQALALNPERKDSLSSLAAEATSTVGSRAARPEVSSDTDRAPEAAARVSGPSVVLALGAIAWAVVLVVPFVVSRPRALAWVVLVGTLAPLFAAGVFWRRELVRRVLTSVVHPAGLALGVALAPRVVELDAHPPTMRLLGALAFLAYGAAASVADPRPAPPGLVIKPLPAVGGDPSLVRRARARAALLGLATFGGLAIAVVAPALGADPTVTFGAEAGAAADVLVAVVAAALGAIVVAGFVGPATRRRRTPTATRRAQRVGLYLLVVAVGALVWRMLATRG